MQSMLITEALQQVKILLDRIAKKQSFVQKYVTYNSRFVDPLAKDGGSSKVIAAELASLKDLEGNLVNIRIAIQKTNLASSLTVEGQTKTVAEWLVWRREVSGGTNSFYSTLATAISTARTLLEREQLKVTSTDAAGAAVKEANVVVNLDELQLSKDSETLGVTLGTLDGKLSIFNATTTVEV